MQRHDEIDATRARHFAWRFLRPGDRQALADLLREAQEEEAVLVDGASTHYEPPPERKASQTSGRTRRCRALAGTIASAWTQADDDERVRLTGRLLGRAERLGIALAGMDAHPAEGVRLIRLLVRYAARMTRRQRVRAARVADAMPLDHPEMADLLVEVARAAAWDIAEAVLEGKERIPGLGDIDAIVARLADVVDEEPNDEARAVAVDLLGRLETGAGTIATLRRALRQPSFAVRARAMHALASASPCAVAAEDLVHIVRGLAASTPPDALGSDAHEEEERMLADAVLLALGHMRPAEVEEALLDLIDADHDSVWLDAGWATEALAAAFPETAAAMVDHWLKCARSHERMRALAAIRRLPLEIAEPRLRLAATDPAQSVREGACQQWLQRFGRMYSVDPSLLVGAECLEGAVGEPFASRLLVMRGGVKEARRAMARVLLGEAPNAEALVLLLQIVGDDEESGEPKLSSCREDWAQTIVERFGAIAVQGLCAMAERFSEPESFGWMRRLGDLLERGVIASAHVGPVRDLAARQIRSVDAGSVDDALRVLLIVGAPVELFDRILSLALCDEIGAHEARRLVVTWPERAIDARLASEMALCLASRDWARLTHAASVALERRAPAAGVIAQRVLEVAESDPQAIDSAVECARRLRQAGQIDTPWALAALERPASPIFAVAARAWPLDPDVRRALESALASPARGGASAVQAAIALLRAEPALSPRDRRLAAVLELATAPQRAELVHVMCMEGASLGSVGTHLAELLVSSDPNVSGALIGVAAWLRSPKARTLLRSVLPRVIDAELRAEIEERLGMHDCYRSLR